ncbi:MAG TPA: serine/threonine-protein kinase [Pyrinomonadaceae bacterium]|nr:serine/threonine-protein kinase [Pyrinomonadaceae bacterium]
MPATKELLQEGRYRINQEFTPNGSEIVYDAYDTVSNSNVVVKEIPAKPETKAAFETQAKLLTGIKHDSLLRVKDFFADAESHYLVMEAVDGDDLHELMRRNKSPFSLEDVVKWADQLLDALNYLHSHRPPFIHKNVKPENVKLTSNGQIKLLAVSSPDAAEGKVSTSLAAEVSSEEALKYAPIEQIWQGLDPASQMAISNGYDERSERILKEPADARSDIYSLGATLYQLVTATEPVNALERSIEVLDGKSDPLKEASKLNPSVPPEISDVLHKAMELKRENRYDSAVIMRQVLSSVVSRYQETAASEAKEREEAAAALQLAEQKRLEQEAASKRAAEEAEAARVAAEAAAKRAAEEAEKKRVEAEKQAKVEADKKAAEAAVALRKEQEAAAANKLAEEKAAKEAKEAEAKAAREAKDKEQATSKAATAVSAEVVAYNDVAAAAVETNVSFGSGYDAADEPKSGFGLLPIFGAGAGLVILIAVAFFVLSGGNDAKAPTTVIGGSTGQNAPASSLETAPDPSQVPAQPADQAAAPAQAPDAQAQARAAAAERDKSKKPGPTPAAKPAEGKKEVTVDDIINDN